MAWGATPSWMKNLAEKATASIDKANQGLAQGLQGLSQVPALARKPATEATSIHQEQSKGPGINTSSNSTKDSQPSKTDVSGSSSSMDVAQAPAPALPAESPAPPADPPGLPEPASSHPLAAGDGPASSSTAAVKPPDSAAAAAAPDASTAAGSAPALDRSNSIADAHAQFAELVKDLQDQVLLEVKRRRSAEAYAEKCKAETRQISDQLDRAQQEVVRLESEASLLSSKHDALLAERDSWVAGQASASAVSSQQDAASALEASEKRCRILEQRLDEAQDTATRGILKMQELEKSLGRSEQERLETAAELKILQSKLKTTIDRNVELTETSYHAEQVVKRFTELEEEMLANREKVRSSDARIQDALDRAAAARDAKETMAKKLAAAEERVATLEALMEGGGSLKRSVSVKEEQEEVGNGAAEPQVARLKAKLVDAEACLKASKAELQAVQVKLQATEVKLQGAEAALRQHQSADAVATVTHSDGVSEKDPDGSRAKDLSQQLAHQLQETENCLDTAWSKLQEKEQYIAALHAELEASKEQLVVVQQATQAVAPVELVIRLIEQLPGPASKGLEPAGEGADAEDGVSSREVVVAAEDVAPPAAAARDDHTDAVSALEDELETLALTLQSFKVNLYSVTNPNTPAGSPGMADAGPPTPGVAKAGSATPASSSRKTGGQRRALEAGEVLLSVQAANAELQTLQETVSVLLEQQQAALTTSKSKDNQIEDLQAQISRLRGMESEVVSLTAQLTAASTQVAHLSDQLSAAAASGTAEQQEVQTRLQEMGSKVEQAETAAAQSAAEVERLQAEASDLQSQLDQAQEQVSELNSKLQQAQEELERVQADQAGLTAQLQESQPQVAELQSQLEQAQEQVSELNSKLQQSQEELERVQADKAGLTAQLQESQPQVAELQSQLEQAQEQVSELNSKLQQSQEELERVQADKAGLTAQLQESQPQVAELQSQLDQAQEQVSELNSKLQQSQEELERVQADKAGLTAQLQESQPQVADLQSQLDQAQEQVSELNSKLQQSQEELERVQADKAGLTAQLQESQPQVAELQSQLEQAQEQVSELNSKLQQSQEELERVQADKAGLTAQLQESQPQVAELQSQLEQAQEQVSELNSKLQQSQEELERVQADKAGLTAQLQESQPQVAELQSQLEQAQEQVSELNSKLQQSQEELERVQADKAGLTAQLQESQPQVADLQSQLDQAQEQVSELNSKLQQSQEELERVQADKAGLTAQLQESQPQVAELQSQLEQAQEQVSELNSKLQQSQEELERVQADKAGLTAQLQESQPQVAELQSQLEQAQEQVSELNSKLQQSQEELERVQADKAGLTAQLQESQPQVAELQSQLEQAQEQAAELNSKLQQSQEELERVQADKVQEAPDDDDPLSAGAQQPALPPSTSATNQPADSDTQLAELSERLQQSVAEVESLSQRLQQAESAAADGASHNQQLQAAVDRLTEQLQQSAAELEGLTRQLETLQSERAVATSTTNREAPDALMDVSLDASAATADDSAAAASVARSQIPASFQAASQAQELVDVPLMDVSLSPGGQTSPGMQPLHSSGASAQSLTNHVLGYGVMLGGEAAGGDEAAGSTAPEMYWRISCQNLEEKVATQEKDHQAQIEKVVTSYQRQLERMEMDHASSMTEYAAVLRAEHQDELSQLLQDNEALKQAVAKAEEIVQEARSKRDQALQNLQDSQDKHAELEERCRSLDADAKERIERLQRLNKQRAAEVDDLTAQVKTLQPRLDKAEAALAEATRLNTKLTAQVAEYKPGSEARAAAETRASAAEAQVVTLTHELQVAKEEVEQLSTKASKLRSVSQEKKRAEERIKELQILVQELQVNADDVLEMRKQVQAADQRRDAAQAEATRSQAMLHNLEHRLAQVEEDNERLSSALDEQLLRQATQQVTADASASSLPPLTHRHSGHHHLMHTTTTTHATISPAASVSALDPGAPLVNKLLSVHDDKGAFMFFRSLESYLSDLPVESWAEWLHARAVEEGQAHQGGEHDTRAKEFSEQWGMGPQQLIERMYAAEAKTKEISKELDEVKARFDSAEELLHQELASAADAHRAAVQALRCQVTVAEDAATQATSTADTWRTKAQQLEEEVQHVRERSRALLEEQEQKCDKLKAELRAFKSSTRPPLPGSISEGGPPLHAAVTPLSHYHPSVTSPSKPTGVGAYHMHTSTPTMKSSGGGASSEIVPIDQLPTPTPGGSHRGSESGMSEVDRLKQQVAELRAAYANSVKVQELQEQSQNCLKQEMANLKASQAVSSQDIGYLRQVLVEGFAKDLLPTDNKLYHVVSSVLKISSQEIENLKASKASSTHHTSSPSLWSGLFGSGK